MRDLPAVSPREPPCPPPSAIAGPEGTPRLSTGLRGRARMRLLLVRPKRMRERRSRFDRGRADEDHEAPGRAEERQPLAEQNRPRERGEHAFQRTAINAASAGGVERWAKICSV